MIAPQADNAACSIPASVSNVNLAALLRREFFPQTSRTSLVAPAFHAAEPRAATRQNKPVLPCPMRMQHKAAASSCGLGLGGESCVAQAAYAVGTVFSIRDLPDDRGTRPIGDVTSAQADAVHMHALFCPPLEPGVSGLPIECSVSLCKTDAGHTAMFCGPLSLAGVEERNIDDNIQLQINQRQVN